MKWTAILVFALFAVTAHAQKSSSRSSDVETPSRGRRKFDASTVRDELGVASASSFWDGDGPRSSSSSSSKRAESRKPQQSASSFSRRRAQARSREDVQVAESDPVAASSVVAPVVAQQFVSRRHSADKTRSSDAAAPAEIPTRRRPPTLSAAPTPQAPDDAPSETSAPERVAPSRFESSRRRSSVSSASEGSGGVHNDAEPIAAPRQRSGGRRSNSRTDGEPAAVQRDRGHSRERGSRREQQQQAVPVARSASGRGRGSSRTTTGATTASTTTTTTTTTTSTEATSTSTTETPQPTKPDEDSTQDSEGSDTSATVPEVSAAPVDHSPLPDTNLPAPRNTSSRKDSASNPVASGRSSSRRGSSRSRPATAEEPSRRPTTRPRTTPDQADDYDLPTGAAAPSASAAFVRTGSRRSPSRSDSTNADSVPNDISQSRTALRSRQPQSEVSSRRGTRRGPTTETDVGTSVQRTSRKINPETSTGRSYKSPRRGSSRKSTTRAPALKEEIDESDNYPPEFIQKIKSSEEVKVKVKPVESAVTASSDDTFITKSSHKVITVSAFPSASPEESRSVADELKENGAGTLNKIDTQKKVAKYSGRIQSSKPVSTSTNSRKVDLLLAPSPPSDNKNQQTTRPTSLTSLRNRYKPTGAYSLRGSRPRPIDVNKEATELDDDKTTVFNKAGSFIESTVENVQVPTPTTTVVQQSTRAAFRSKSGFKGHRFTKPVQSDSENIVTAPGSSEAQISFNQQPTRRSFIPRGRSASYRKDGQTSTTLEDLTPIRKITPRPTTGRTRTTSGFRRSITATASETDDSQMGSTPISLVGTQRFSARFRSDLLLATGGLRPTPTPAYVPTVPLVRTTSAISTDASSVGPGKWSASGGRADTRSPRVNLL